jgi:hypothetical protein
MKATLQATVAPQFTTYAHVGERRYSPTPFIASALGGGGWPAPRPRVGDTVPTVQHAQWAENITHPNGGSKPEQSSPYRVM